LHYGYRKGVVAGWLALFRGERGRERERERERERDGNRKRQNMIENENIPYLYTLPYHTIPTVRKTERASFV